MPAFRLNGEETVVVKRICFLFVQGNAVKNDVVVRQKVKITVCTCDEWVAWIIPAVPVFLWLLMFF